MAMSSTNALGKFFLAAVAGFSIFAAHAEQPRIAVTDLSYEETVSAYFQDIEYKEKLNASSSSSGRYRDSDYSSSGSGSERSRASSDVSFKSSTGFRTYIARGELRKFTADIKGELLRAGYRVVQGKPWTQKNTEKLYDIIARIKQGYYPGADYVLWGSINNVEFRDEVNPIQGSNASSVSLSLELVGEFSLINTKTFEVRAAFSAMGEGNDTKLINAAGTRVSLNRSKVMQETSRSLGEAVANEVISQFGGDSGYEPRGERGSGSRHEVREEREEKVIIFK